MSLLNPSKLFRYLAREIPDRLHGNTYIVGSLAAAYHFRAGLGRQTVNTKDADVVVHPAGNLKSLKRLAMALLEHGWKPTADTVARRARNSRNLRAIRLNPATPGDYFIEILGLPAKSQRRNLAWTPVRLKDGWYGLPSHRFMAVSAVGTIASAEGLRYAAPANMALANLLSHPRLGRNASSRKGSTPACCARPRTWAGCWPSRGWRVRCVMLQRDLDNRLRV